MRQRYTNAGKRVGKRGETIFGGGNIQLV